MSSTIQPSIRLAATSVQPLTLRQGQVIHGSIQKIFPDQRAELQVGNQKMMAQLEVPLKAGDAHFFQVLGGKDALQLKVVTDALQPSTTSNSHIKQLMDSLQLPKSTEMQGLVQQMVKENIPLSKDQLLRAEQWLKEMPPHVKKSDGFLAILKMTELKLNFTVENFRMLVSGQDKNGLTQLFDTLKMALQQDSTMPPSQKTTLENTLTQISHPFAKELGGAIVGQVMERLNSDRTSLSDKTILLNLLKEAGLVSKQATLTNLLNPINQSSSAEPSDSTGQVINPTASKDQALAILTSLTGKQVDDKLFAQLSDLARKSNHNPVQQVLTAAEETIHSGMNRVSIEQAMKQILGNIGFAYEAKLTQPDTNLSQLSDSLKPQLLALLQNQTITEPLKETAEMIVSRLNGMQILSGENGPQYQLLMQVPLDFLGKRMDASLQWNGRMKEDGKIDSDYARVMFYLDLASLKETVIDMQVQNRVITINIFNEDDAIFPYAEPFKEALKTGLSSLNYQLSGVFMKSTTKQPDPPAILTKNQSDRWGVDILI